MLKGLDSTGKHKIGYGQVNAFNKEGTIAARRSLYYYKNFEEFYHATIWLGKNWTPHDLGSFLKPDEESKGFSYSSIMALNNEGTIAVGDASFERKSVFGIDVYPAILRIRYNKNLDSVEESEIIATNTSPDKLNLEDINITIDRPVNPITTQTSILQFGADSMALLTSQFTAQNAYYKVVTPTKKASATALMVIGLNRQIPKTLVQV